MFQGSIALCMTILIVDFFEMIDVHGNIMPNSRPCAESAKQKLRQLFFERAPVWQTGQGIVASQLLELRLDSFHRRDVHGQSEESGHATV